MKTCHKTTFEKEKTAKARIAEIAASRGRHTKPIRAYHCERCGGWHLTSWAFKRFKHEIFGRHRNR